MKLSYNELQKLGFQLDLELIEKKMFQLGHEVEEVDNLTIDNLVIGQIEKLVNHPNADTLRICQVNTGKDSKQIICGAPNTYEGQKVIVAMPGAIINNQEIKKSEIREIKSEGMLCSLSELNFPKEFLQDEDIEGIYDVPKQIEVGTNPMESLNLGDKILDIFLTANRGDCQSYRGIYNDLKALLEYDKIVELNEFPLLENEIKNKVELENPYNFKINKEYVNYYSTQLISNIEIDKSQYQTQFFLLKHGIKAQNNITDISNQVLLETGIPSHIYDADKIKGNIAVDLTQKEEKFKGLDGKEILIPKGYLVIKDEEKIISLAGVMGSEETKITKETKNILIEVADFSSELIFKASKLLGRKTESALRYEKRIDLKILSLINTVIIEKIEKNNKNLKISEIIEEMDIKKENAIVTLKLENIEKYIGINIESSLVRNIFEKLQFKIEKEDNSSISIIAPSYRHDINTENDLIEEIIRIYNIDNLGIDGNLNTFISQNKIISDNTYKNSQKIEEILLKLGIDEVITYSLVSDKQIMEFNPNYDEKKIVKLMSPMSKEYTNYRQSLIPSLIDVASKNIFNQYKNNTIFEIGNTYLQETEIKEELKLGILLTGNKSSQLLKEDRNYNFFDLKGLLETLFRELKLTFELEKTDNLPEQLNPYSSALIKSDNQEIGLIGEVVFDYSKKIKQKIYVLEINLNYIFSKLNENYQYINQGNFPAIERDFTFEVAKNTSYQEIIKIFESIKYVKEINLIDIYEGEHIAEDKKSITLKVTFKDNMQTLTNELLENEINKIFILADQNQFYINR